MNLERNTLDFDVITTYHQAEWLATQGVVFITDARLSDARVPVAHNHPASDITDFSSAVNAAVIFPSAISGPAVRKRVWLGV